MLDVKIFKYQTKLRVLRLGGNQLSSIQPDSFIGLSQLQVTKFRIYPHGEWGEKFKPN